jgi:sec-independent protein translocase protein TatA
MGSFSIWHWLIVLILVVVLFGGRGKLSAIMGDAAKGIKAFQKGLKGDDDTPADRPAGTLPRGEAEKDDLRR